MIFRTVQMWLVGITVLLVGSARGSEKTTRDGTPVLSMWAAPMPDPKRPGAGFELLKNVEVANIFRPQSQDEAYSHCPELAWHAGRYHAMWINHPEGEDLPGQRVLYSSSSDARTWSPAVELYSPPGPLKRRSEGGPMRGTRTKSYAWYKVDGRLFAIAGCYDEWRKDLTVIAREVLRSGLFGPAFALQGKVQVPTTWPVLSADDPSIATVAEKLWTMYQSPLTWPTQAPVGWSQPTVDEVQLWEPSVYRASDGRLVGLWRPKNFCHRMYGGISSDGRTFASVQPTDIPDTPSLARTVSLPGGGVLLVGNQVAGEFDNGDKVRHLSRDPLTVAISRDGYRFEKVYALRSGAPKLRFKGTGGVGFQYPAAIVHDGKLVVVHTVGKEDVDVAVVSLVELGLKEKAQPDAQKGDKP